MSRPSVRMITAGVRLAVLEDLDRVGEAVEFLGRARQAFVSAGHDVQTARVATQPLAELVPAGARDAALDALAGLDRIALERDLYLGVGPAITSDEHEPSFAEWAAELARRTRRIGFSVAVAGERRVHRRAARTAAETIAALAAVDSSGEGNFLFAAAALIPAGTPFFPVAWAGEGRTFSLGLESAGLVGEALAGEGDERARLERLRRRLNDALGPLERLARELAEATGWRYLGMDVSPAPSPAASIAEAVEELSGVPFGAPGTVAACAAITEALRGLEVDRCGYSGLMLPLLEDRVLARRAGEGRFGLSELLLCSSVCGAGLDTVPLPGDTPVGVLAGLIEDTAALAVRHRKPLAARLLPIAGKMAGDVVSIDNPYLVPGVVMDPLS